MWIPTTEGRLTSDLNERAPRDAAQNELKHWVKNRFRNIGINTIPSPDNKKKGPYYWPKLLEALTPQNIATLTELIERRQRERVRALETSTSKATARKTDIQRV